MPLFDAYLVVDWSAASRPVQGADSIWYALVRDGAVVAAENPATRREAEGRIGDLLAQEHAAGRRVLAGFDFPIGYSAGFAKRLGGSDWHDVWTAIDSGLKDDEQNCNNRFDVAAALNRRAGAPMFWGCPVGWSDASLGPTNPRRYEGEGIEERRWCERRVSGPQPVWKLYGNGSAGSQALTGIPVLKRLRERLAAKVWPFETGLGPSRDGIVLAEVYPSLVQPEAGFAPKDLGQVRALASHFSTLDRDGELAAYLAGDPSLTASQRADVEREEAWILGVTKEGIRRAKTVKYDYLRDPDAIYERSFALVRAETDLSQLPEALHGMALRLVHTCGEPKIVDDLAWSKRAVTAGKRALANGATVLVDAPMVAQGVTRVKNQVLCKMPKKAPPGETRAAAGVERWAPHLEGAVVAIGNAPTALFRLLELVEAGAPKPALVLGFPVGFVGAVESKAALIGNRLGLEYVALRGRRGGSALAAAAVNALAS